MTYTYCERLMWVAIAPAAFRYLARQELGWNISALKQLSKQIYRQMIINQAYGLYKTDPAVLRDQRSRRTRALKMPPRLKFAPQLKYSPLETVSTLECAAVEATEVTTPPRPVVALVDA